MLRTVRWLSTVWPWFQETAKASVGCLRCATLFQEAVEARDWMSLREKYPQELMFSAILFLLPEVSEEEMVLIQEQFLRSRAFWQPYLARLHLWARPFGVSKTEAPDGEPALILITELCETEDVLARVGHEIAEALRCPAYTVTHVGLNAAERQEIKANERPWD